MPFAASLAPLVDFVFPPRCPLCREAVGAQSGLCAVCWSKLAIPGDPCCESCGRPFAEGIAAGSTCAPCLADPPVHNGIVAATLYNDASRQLVLAFKHGNRLGLAPLMARLILANFEDADGADWVVVPVPLHRWRLWRRGYNQAAVLAREITRITGAVLAVDALTRHKGTASLGGLGRKARKRELSGAIRMTPAQTETVRGRKVLLVDDVMTSGATSDVCVAALRKAGAAEVVVACFARVLDEALDAT